MLIIGIVSLLGDLQASLTRSRPGQGLAGLFSAGPASVFWLSAMLTVGALHALSPKANSPAVHHAVSWLVALV